MINKNINQIHQIYFYLYIIKYINSQLQTINSNVYSYDSVGNKLSKQDSVGTHNYSYDNTYQLTQATHPPQAGQSNEAFAYDAVGNRTNTTVDAANKLLQDPNATYQYDANGNRYIKTQSDGSITYYSYDYEGRLTRVETQKPGLTSVAVYKYDALGRRFEKAVTENSVTTTTRYLYDGFNIVAEYDDNNNVKAQYIHNLGIDDQLAMIKNGNTYYYHKDGLDSITAITDSSANVVQTYEYDSFGNIINQTGTITQPYTFTGREFDSESGLYFYRARELDSKTGTFTQKDPIGFKGGDANLYRYVWNRPTGYIDPFGLFGIGMGLSESIEGGNTVLGAGQTGSVGTLTFFKGFNLKDLSFGDFASWGGLLGGPGYGYFSEGDNKNFITGGFAGGGANVLITNAKCINELSGSGKTLSLNIGWKARVLSLQFTISKNGIWLFSYGGPIAPNSITGAGYGLSISLYNTYTGVAK